MTDNPLPSLFVAGKFGGPSLALAGLAVLALSGGLLLASPATDPLARVPVCRASGAGASPGRRFADRAFMAENEVAMTRMMTAMTILPRGDVDQDFVAMMVAHHQGAIDMAVAELRHGRNEQLRRIAQEIIVTQGQEIQAMRSAKLAAYATSGRNSSTTASGRAAVAFDNQGVVLSGATERVP